MGTISVIILIILGLYVISRVEKQIRKERFSYKLEVAVTPHWFEILKHQYPKLSEKELEKFIDDSKKKTSNETLFQNAFPTFVEFYDNMSGMHIKWMALGRKTDSWQGYCDEFEINGNIFDFPELAWGEHDEKLKVKISNNSIITMKKDKNYVMPPQDLFEEDKLLSYIPLEELKEFFIDLGNRFHDIEMHSIVKWPEKFQQIFKKHHIKHFRWDDDEPTLFDVGGHDKKLLEKWKGLKVSLYGGSSNPSHRFETKYADYDIRIKLFRPE